MNMNGIAVHITHHPHFFAIRFYNLRSAFPAMAFRTGHYLPMDNASELSPHGQASWKRV
jgi:hypothetical protein